VKEARVTRPDLRVLLLTSGSSARGVRFAGSIGGAGSLSRHANGDALVRSVAALLNQRRGSDRGLAATGRSVPDAMLKDQLTRREVVVLRLLAQARSNDQIGAELSISPHTVRTHVQNLLWKLDAHSRNEAVAIGRRIGVLDERRPAAGFPRESP
jgi:DNA-binding NarL/FixJ family response regulator